MKAWPATSLLGRLAPDERAGLLALGTTRRHPAGATLVHAGGADRVAYVLLSGCAKVIGHAADGRETMLAVRMRGDLVGEITALYGGERSATVEVVADVDAVAVGHREFRAFLRRSPAAAEAVHQTVAGKLRQATGVRTGIGGARTPVRVAEILCQLAAVHGRRTGASYVVEAPLTQADLGALVGASKASVERAVARLRARGLVSWSRRAVEILDLDGLRAFVDRA